MSIRLSFSFSAYVIASFLFGSAILNQSAEIIQSIRKHNCNKDSFG
nr:MAG TPA: hypothetical protein [Caudoviricetes sp.]